MVFGRGRSAGIFTWFLFFFWILLLFLGLAPFGYYPVSRRSFKACVVDLTVYAPFCDYSLPAAAFLIPPDFDEFSLLFAPAEDLMIATLPFIEMEFLVLLITLLRKRG